MTEPAKTTAVDDARKPAPRCRTCGSLRLEPDPAGYHVDAETEDGAPLLCIECQSAPVSPGPIKLQGQETYELRAKVAELETQLRQEREAHQLNSNKWEAQWKIADNYSAECDRRINQFHEQVSQLQATISQLREANKKLSQRPTIWHQRRTP